MGIWLLNFNTLTIRNKVLVLHMAEYIHRSRFIYFIAKAISLPPTKFSCFLLSPHLMTLSQSSFHNTGPLQFFFCSVQILLGPSLASPVRAHKRYKEVKNFVLQIVRLQMYVADMSISKTFISFREQTQSEKLSQATQ